MGVRGKNAVVALPKHVLERPAALSEPARLVWDQLIACVDPGHFVKSDAPLLAEYARAIALAQEAHAEIERTGAVMAISGRPSPWLAVLAQQNKSIVALAARLRLCPQSRFDRTRAGTLARTDPDRPKPWEFKGGGVPLERMVRP